jgi:hypothetical protein
MARDFAKLYGFGCLGLIVVLFAAGVMMNRSWSRCPPVLDQRLPAPGAELEAVAFHYECGFGRKGTINISIVLPGQAPMFPGNLFAAMDSSGVNLALGRSQPPRVEIAWQSATEITVRYEAGARVMGRNEAARGVSARYEEMKE